MATLQDKDGKKSLKALVKERVREVLRSGAKSLDLRSLGLAIPPNSLGQLVQLRALDLSVNELTFLPDWLSSNDPA